MNDEERMRSLTVGTGELPVALCFESTTLRAALLAVLAVLVLVRRLCHLGLLGGTVPPRAHLASTETHTETGQSEARLFFFLARAPSAIAIAGSLLGPGRRGRRRRRGLGLGLGQRQTVRLPGGSGECGVGVRRIDVVARVRGGHPRWCPRSHRRKGVVATGVGVVGEEREGMVLLPWAWWWRWIHHDLRMTALRVGLICLNVRVPVLGSRVGLGLLCFGFALRLGRVGRGQCPRSGRGGGAKGQRV